VVDDALYVRGYNGQKSRWYQAAVRQKAGRIIAAGMTKEVTFEAIGLSGGITTLTRLERIAAEILTVPGDDRS
jgi:hypothetical protein